MRRFKVSRDRVRQGRKYRVMQESLVREEFNREEAVEEIEACLSLLIHEDREILRLRAEGLRLIDVAEILGLSKERVRQRQKEAIRVIRERISDG